MNKDDLVQEVGTLLITDPKISSDPWVHLVIVAQVMPTSLQVNGFAYSETGKASPTGPRNLDVLDRFEDLRASMSEPGKESWKACLVRIDRPSGDISIDFEYDHPESWLITPANGKRMAEKLRPHRG
jgi:hypothetical protein